MRQPDVRTTCLRLLRDPSARETLERLSRYPAHAVAAPLVQSWAAAGLCVSGPNQPRLTRLGRSVAYHLAEYRNQIEDGAAQRFVSQLDIRRDSSILDVGCGAGQSLVALLRQQPRLGVGLDWDPIALGIFSAVREFEQLPNALPVRGNAEALPFADRSFDRILCRVVLMHVRVLPTLAEMARVSQVGGLVYLHLTDFRFYWRKLLRLRWERGGVPLALVNGLLLQLCAMQVRMRATRTMSYQTIGMVTRRLERHGFEVLEVEQDRARHRGEGHQPKVLARRQRAGRTVGWG